MRYMKRISRGMLASVLAFIVASCGGDRVHIPDNLPPPEPEVEFDTVSVVAATGCIAEGGKPDKVQPLKGRYTREEWDSLAPGAKAQAVRAQSGERLNYEDSLDAATAGCD